MRDHAPISSIYRLGKPDAPEPDFTLWSRIERLRRRAWLDCGVVSVIPTELPEHLAAELKAWAEQQYGER